MRTSTWYPSSAEFLTTHTMIYQIYSIYSYIVLLWATININDKARQNWLHQNVRPKRVNSYSSQYHIIVNLFAVLFRHRIKNLRMSAGLFRHLIELAGIFRCSGRRPESLPNCENFFIEYSHTEVWRIRIFTIIQFILFILAIHSMRSWFGPATEPA